MQTTAEHRLKTSLIFEAEAVPHLTILKQLALHLVRNAAEAEDLVQETFAQALRSFDRYEPGTNCRAWLCKIMFHKRSQAFRANKRFVALGDCAHLLLSNANTNLPHEFVGAKLSAALSRLPENFRQVVVLCVVEEFTYREAAEHLRIPIGTVMSRLHRGRKMLRAALAAAAAKAESRAHLQ